MRRLIDVVFSPAMLVIAVVFIGALSLHGRPAAASQPAPLGGATVEIFFSPNGGCTEAIVAELGTAKSSVYVQAYSFTSAPIAQALVDARNRGVTVAVVLDKSQRGERYTSADFLVHAGVPVYIDDRHAIAHNKIMIIDGATVITGSFNFTKAAEEHNAENLLVIKGLRELVLEYQKNFNLHARHSSEYRGR